jgi:hypothetical protein
MFRMNDLTTFEAQKILHDWRQFHIDIFQNLFSYKNVDEIIKFHKPENCFLILQRLLCIDATFIKSFKMYKSEQYQLKNNLFFQVVLKDFIFHRQYKNTKLGISFLKTCPFYDTFILDQHIFNIPIQYYIFF